jgi:hypothetical protein
MEYLHPEIVNYKVVQKLKSEIKLVSMLLYYALTSFRNIRTLGIYICYYDLCRGRVYKPKAALPKRFRLFWSTCSKKSSINFYCFPLLWTLHC